MKEKYRIPTILILTTIAIVVNFMLADLFLFPKETIQDHIISRKEISRENKHYKARYGSTKQILRYKFYTEEGFEFTTKKRPVEGTTIKLTHTKILRNITNITTTEKDYTKTLVSDLNGLNLYFSIILSISTLVSIMLLRTNRNMTDNSFQNIINFNSIMIFFMAMVQFYI